MSPRKHSRVVDVLVGFGYLGLVGLLVVGALAAYNKTFQDSTEVTLRTSKLGNSLQEGSDVKLHGVPVGRVDAVEAVDGGATLTLDLDPGVADDLSADTVARLLPKTLFGERYVSLREPDGGGSGLSDGDVIHEDTSAEAVELQEVFDQILPVLQSIEPAKLSAALGEMATMLRGQGGDLGDMMASWGRYFEKLNPLVPAMTEDLAKFAQVSENYADAAPDLLAALDAMSTTSGTMVDERSNLTSLFASVITSADTTEGWVDENQQTIEILSGESRRALEAVAPYSSEFPCLLRSARKFIPVMDKTLGEGTDEPGVHVVLNVVPARGKYLPGEDAPHFETDGKPSCPYTTGETGDPQPAGSPPRHAPPPSDLVESKLREGKGLGEVNSPAENRLIAELMAPTQGMAPSEYPDWGSLLVGPLLRDAEVVLR